MNPPSFVQVRTLGRPYRLAGMLAFCACLLAPPIAKSERIKIGLLNAPPAGPIYIARDAGYFRAEGLEAELVFFDAAQPVATAVASGSIDFGSAGLTAGFYALAGQGALRIIAASNREAPGFHSMAFVVSNSAYAAGVRTFRDVARHSVAISQIGSPQHYALALVAEKYGFDLRSVRLLPLQSVPNQISAVTGGQADISMAPATALMPLVQHDAAKLLGWVGDETPWQLGAVFAATHTANGAEETIRKFLRAFRHGVGDYHNAFTGADGKREDSPTAGPMLAALAQDFHQPVDQVAAGITYFDSEARLDVVDVLHQIAWYKSQAMLKPEIKSEDIVDRRYVVALPTP